MPKGPKGEKRPADVIGAAVKVMQIATGEIEETTDDGKNKAAVELGRKGGKARAEKMTPERRSEIARKAEIEKEIAGLRLEISEIDAELNERRHTGDLAARIIEELREAGSEVVEGELRRIQPILQRLYARIDPHVAFRAVRLLTEYRRGRGNLRTSVIDTAEDVSADEPGIVLSSSQMNALAVSVFLAFNLGLPSLPLQAAILDDPLQSLDDVNLLGLIDMLRRTKERRQLFLSTHDARFAGLLERKLRPIRAGQRTIVIELSGWSRQGPLVEFREISADTEALRIVA